MVPDGHSQCLLNKEQYVLSWFLLRKGEGSFQWSTITKQ